MLPKWQLVEYYEPEKFRIEYEPAQDYFRATVWIYWTWKAKGRRLLISMPDFI